MMKRIIPILLAVLLVAALFAGCGSDDADPTTAAATENSDKSASDAATEATTDNTVAAETATDNPFGFDSSSDPVGLYYAKTYYGMSIEDAITTYMLEDGMTMEEYLQEAGISSPGETFTIELKADGSATATNTTIGATQASDGTWTQDGDQVTVTIDGDPETFTLSGNELSVTESGLDFVFVKQ